MKQLSLWAHHHKGTARLLIALCYIVLNGAGFLIGDLLGLLGVQVSALFVHAVTVTAIGGFIGYPSPKEKHHYRNYYRRQKTFDALLITTTLLFVVSASNLRQEHNTPFSLPAAAAVVPVSVSPAPVISSEAPVRKASFVKKVTTTLTHTFQKVRNWYKRLDTRDKIILTTLLALMAGLALYGVISWACSLSCSGSEATGWIVLIAGTGVVLFLVLLAGRTINRLYRQRKDRRQGQPANG